LVIGFIISLGALAGLVWYLDGQAVIDAFKKVRLIWVLIVLILLFISLLSRAGAWRVILGERISIWQSFFIVNAGYFVNTVFPFRIGEITRVFLLLPSDFTFWEALPTVILERMFDVLFAVGLFLAGLPFALGYSDNMIYAYILGCLVIIGLAVLVLLVKFQKIIINWLEGIQVPWTGLKTKSIEKTRYILSGLKILNHPAQMLKTFLGMLASWGIALLYQYILLRSFIPDAQFVWAVFALGALALGVSVPSSPGNIGLYEASLTLALSAFGVEWSLAFTYALTSHILSLGMTTLFGVYALVNEGYKLSDVWRFSLEGRKEEQS
jgi:uncharacterized protein (TIRG00374 family)